MGVLMAVDMRDWQPGVQGLFNLRPQLCLQLTSADRTDIKAFGKGHIIRRQQAVVPHQRRHLGNRQHSGYAAHQR